MSDENIIVKVHGTAIYKAVKNYLNNNPIMQSLIEQNVKTYFEGSILKDHIKRKLDDLVTNRYYSDYKDEFKKALKELITDESKIQIKKEIEVALKETLNKSILIVNNSEISMEKK